MSGNSNSVHFTQPGHLISLLLFPAASRSVPSPPKPPPQLPRLFLVFLHTDRGGRRSLLLGPAVAFPPLGPDGGVPSSEAPSAPKFTPGVNFKSCAAINRSDWAAWLGPASGRPRRIPKRQYSLRLHSRRVPGHSPPSRGVCILNSLSSPYCSSVSKARVCRRE